MEDNQKKTLAALKREMEEMKAAYEKKISEMQGGEEEKSDDGARFREFLKREEAWLNEYVEVRLFKDNEKYRDDVYVAINGKNCVIKRGEWVKIKRKFALVLDQSEIQDMQTAEMLEAEQNRFRAAEEAQG